MRPKYSRGFTILELVMNVAIVGILAAIAAPAFITFRDKARISQAKADLRKIQQAIEVLALDTDKWPGPSNVGETADQEVWDLNSGRAGLVRSNGGFPGWKGPYMKSVSRDPWEMNYFFDPDYYLKGSRYAVIGSFGPNKCCRNRYDSDDVVLKLATK